MLATFCLLALSAPAFAQATRTWVSGVGDDANPCSRTAPCKTFAGAISKTAAGGEIDALDPGGYGGLTITKSITIDGGGDVAGVLVSGTNGITIAGNSAVGVSASAGTLSVSDSLITGNAFGAQATGAAIIRLSNNQVLDNTTSFGCGGGVLLSAGNNTVAGGAAGCPPAGGVTVQ